jgi:hypothetical protein
MITQKINGIFYVVILASGKPKGLLINFNSLNIKEQLVSLVTEEFARLPKE